MWQRLALCLLEFLFHASIFFRRWVAVASGRIIPRRVHLLLVFVADLPPALFSYLFYTYFKKFRMPQLRQRIVACSTEGEWSSTAKQLLQTTPIAEDIDYFLCLGPRFNTHLLLHHLYGIDRCSTVEVENVKLDGYAWQVVAYGGDAFRETLGSTGPIQSRAEWLPLEVSLDEAHPLLNLSLRPYVWGRDTAPLPHVRVDGNIITKRTHISHESTDFYLALRDHATARHTAMMWHVHTLLQLRALDEGWVRAMFLPVGNPNTQWLYGTLKASCSLRVRASVDTLRHHLILTTVYSRSSMPLRSSRVSFASQWSVPVAEDTFWTVRVVRKDGKATTEDALVLADPSETNLLSSGDVIMLFPGQGCHRVGMASSLASDQPSRAIFEEASKLVGYDLWQLVQEGPEAALNSSVCSQIAIFVTSYAMARYKSRHMRITSCAGLSLGEYTALVFAGHVSFAEGIRLVEARGVALQYACEMKDTAMMQVIDPTAALKFETLQQGDCWIATDLCATTATFSGTASSIESMRARLAALGGISTKLLKVAGAFHTPFMSSAQAPLREALEKVCFLRSSVSVYSNFTGCLHMDDAASKVDCLVKQLVEPVRWADISAHMPPGAAVVQSLGSHLLHPVSCTNHLVRVVH